MHAKSQMKLPLTMRDLKRFCYRSDPRCRVPWSHSRFTYATNRHVLVRVPRLPDVAEPETPFNPEPILKSIATQRVTPLPAIEFPPPPGPEDCPYCTDCPEYRTECATCDGAGVVFKAPRLVLRGAWFNPEYIKLITRLPGVKFSAKPPQMGAARFVFADGGAGALMPMHPPYQRA